MRAVRAPSGFVAHNSPPSKLVDTYGTAIYAQLGQMGSDATTIGVYTWKVSPDGWVTPIPLADRPNGAGSLSIEHNHAILTATHNGAVVEIDLGRFHAVPSTVEQAIAKIEYIRNKLHEI